MTNAYFFCMEDILCQNLIRISPKSQKLDSAKLKVCGYRSLVVTLTLSMYNPDCLILIG